MSATKRAHGFHVIKNNLLVVSLRPRQVLNALGQQTGQSAVIDGAIVGFLRHFHDHWRNFLNLTLANYVADMSPTCRQHMSMSTSSWCLLRTKLIEHVKQVITDPDGKQE